jgi:hypothetical protein
MIDKRREKEYSHKSKIEEEHADYAKYREDFKSPGTII